MPFGKKHAIFLPGHSHRIWYLSSPIPFGKKHKVHCFFEALFTKSTVPVIASAFRQEALSIQPKIRSWNILRFATASFGLISHCSAVHLFGENHFFCNGLQHKA
jgi:hypothetical protein